MEKLKLTPKQTIAAARIAVGDSHQEAAKAAKVSPQTVSEWMQQPEFGAVINHLQLSILYNAQDKLRGLVYAAIDNISKLLVESKSEKVKLDAAKFVLGTIRIAPHKDYGLWIPKSLNEASCFQDEIQK